MRLKRSFECAVSHCDVIVVGMIPELSTNKPTKNCLQPKKKIQVLVESKEGKGT